MHRISKLDRQSPALLLRRLAPWAVFGLLVAGCVYDDNDRCGPNEHLADKDRLCICDDGFSYTATGCVPISADAPPPPKSCTSDADCTDTGAANYCETLLSHTCLIPDCNPAPNDCPTGYECCPFVANPIPGVNPPIPNLCLLAGLCNLL